MADITMPQLGETVTEGTITRWLKQVGDAVAEDDVLFEVSTDKVDSEVPSPVTGYVAQILVPEGETVDVGTKLAVISNQVPDEAPTNGGKGADSEAPAPPPPVSTTDVTPAPKAPPSPQRPKAVPDAQSPETLGGASTAGGAEPGGASTAGGVEPAGGAEPAGGPESAAVAGGERPGVGTRPHTGSPSAERGTAPAGERAPSGGGGNKVLSPVVRRLLAEHDLDPSEIGGSGAGGRITRDDVLALIDRKGSAPAPSGLPTTTGAGSSPPSGAPGPTPAPPGETAEPGADDTVVPFTNIRRRTAEHMVRSKHTSAHTVVAMEVDYLAVERVRSAEGRRFKEHEGVSLNYLPFIARAVIDAIADWPHMNSSVGDDVLIVHNRINLGIAVDLNFEGLLVPVIHGAADKRLAALARDIASLAERARSKRLTMDDISGGTFTLTNAGPFGTLFTIPVINQPQIAIIATDGVRKKPVVVTAADGSDSIAIHPVGNLILAFDHRAVDGAYASAFMRAIKDTLEHRDWSNEL